MLKLKLTKDEFDQLDESKQSLYSQSDDGYALQVDGMEDTGALKRAKDHEKELRKEAEKQAKEFQSQLSELQGKIESIETEKLKGSGDIDAIMASAQKAKEDAEARIKQMEDEFKQKEQALVEQSRQSFLDGEVKKLSTSLAKDGCADVIVPHLKSKLGVIDDNGNNKLVVMGDDGKPSHLTIDDFKTEFTSNSAFAPVLKGSQASGSGATGANEGGGTAKTFNDYTSAELVELRRDNPQAYDQLKQNQH